MNETSLMKKIMLAVSWTSIMFRNNVGAFKKDDRWIEYGVCNPGGSDLIGWTRVEVTQEMVGKTIAVFTALEVKTDKGKASKEQKAFIAAVRNAGGIADVVRSEEQALSVVKNSLR